MNVPAFGPQTGWMSFNYLKNIPCVTIILIIVSAAVDKNPSIPYILHLYP
jgi:hypothetical protein